MRLNPLRSLRVRLALLITLAIGGLAVFTIGQFSDRLTNAYREAGRQQLSGIAETYANAFRVSQLDDPQDLQKRINNLRRRNETLHKISVSWHGKDGKTLLVQDGHEHDPDGTKRDVSTARAVRSGNRSSPAPDRRRRVRLPRGPWSRRRPLRRAQPPPAHPRRGDRRRDGAALRPR